MGSIETNSAEQRRVAVVGSLNVDILWRVGKLPRPGSTVLATQVHEDYGGKGANQAVAAARQGAQVTMIGAVGDDEHGRRYRAHLADEGITFVPTQGTPNASLRTGLANIYVDPCGENMIVVHAGANADVSAPAVAEALRRELRAGDILVLQLEVPIAVVQAAFAVAAEQRAITIFNAAPHLAEWRWGQREIDIVVVNEHECRDYFAREADSLLGLTAKEAVAFLQPWSARHLVITRGDQSTLWLSDRGVVAVPIYPVTPIDTVGAGDTFVGAFAAALAGGLSMTTAVYRANLAAAISTLGHGAQAAMPRLSQVLERESAAGSSINVHS